MSNRNRQEPAPPAARAQAVVEALTEKKLIPNGFLDAVTMTATEMWSPRNGARVVAKAWVDAEYRKRLLTDGTAACAELGYSGPEGEYIVVLEDTPKLHNVIVCTQCSCTAWPVLGLPPDWYKSPEYRARVVREPRPLLREMGLDLPESVAIRVWDTTAETRYMVLPLRPPGTDGWSEERLAELVTREAMIGVALVERG
ncbi:MAG TPA: nitrile hydratase subunit alpha [Candidatus Limnocylindrales bacterium]|nr:nitrile hydratase subunit alpha [Candidatus Limnocylindrales bacterium]